MQVCAEVLSIRLPETYSLQNEALPLTQPKKETYLQSGLQ
jgi:hypothetical protein